MIGHSLTPSFEVDSEDLRLKKRLCISCEDTCSQAETKPERLSKSSEESYNGLINFFLSNLNEKSSFKEIRRVAKIAIEKGMTESDFTKQHLVLFALKKLETLHISIKMQTILFAAIEAFMLSRRISNLRS